MVWKVCFDTFNLGHLVWDVWLERVGLSKDFGKKTFGGKFRRKDLVQKMIGSRYVKNMEKLSGEKEEFGQENCCQKNVGPKKFLVSNNFAREKFVSKNIW